MLSVRENGSYSREKFGNKGNKRREMKQTKMGEEREGWMGKYFLCALLAVLHSGPIISWAVLGTLCSITGNTAAHPPQQNNIQPTSHLDTTWQTETLKYGGGGSSGKWEGRGGQVSMGAADCYNHETFNKNSNMPENYRGTRTQDKYCSCTDCTWQNLRFTIVKGLNGWFYIHETIKRL